MVLQNEPRRLIKFSNSFVISIPKEWVEKSGLKKGDIVYLDEENDSIKITFRAGKTAPVEEKKIIDVENKTFEEVNRRLISAYINNYSEIILKGKNEEIRKNLSMLMDKIGIDIMENTSDEIVIKDFLNIESMSIEKTIRRIDNMIRSLFEDLQDGAKREIFREWVYKEMCKVDKEINKIYFLLWKTVKKGQKNPSLFKEKLNLKQEDLANIQWIAMHLEAIADEIKRIAKFLINTPLTKEKIEFLKIMDMIEKSYTDLMTSYYQKNSEQTLKVIEKKEGIMKACNKWAEKWSGKKISPNIGAICERMKTMASAIHHISKVIAY